MKSIQFSLTQHSICSGSSSGLFPCVHKHNNSQHKWYYYHYDFRFSFKEKYIANMYVTKPYLDCEANIKNTDLKSVYECFKPFPGYITESMHIYIHLKVILTLQSNNKSN